MTPNDIGAAAGVVFFIVFAAVVIVAYWRAEGGWGEGWND